MTKGHYFQTSSPCLHTQSTYRQSATKSNQNLKVLKSSLLVISATKSALLTEGWFQFPIFVPILSQLKLKDIQYILPLQSQKGYVQKCNLSSLSFVRVVPLLIGLFFEGLRTIVCATNIILLMLTLFSYIHLFPGHFQPNFSICPLLEKLSPLFYVYSGSITGKLPKSTLIKN